MIMRLFDTIEGKNYKLEIWSHGQPLSHQSNVQNIIEQVCSKLPDIFFECEIQHVPAETSRYLLKFKWRNREWEGGLGYVINSRELETARSLSTYREATSEKIVKIIKKQDVSYATDLGDNNLCIPHDIIRDTYFAKYGFSSGQAGRLNS
jgi:hypothetical protein